jgi:hypothetical protein
MYVHTYKFNVGWSKKERKLYVCTY